VLDTAGIRETKDTVEKIGVERSLKTAQQADLILFTIDAQEGWTSQDAEIYQKIKNRPLILVINKNDLKPSESLKNIPDVSHKVYTAMAKDEGIDALEKAILNAIQVKEIESADLDFAINQRQKAALIRAKTALIQVQETIINQLPLDFWTIDLRSAIQALGEITGEEITESVLERIFSRFCIGK
jgi:tRNA modification GTPase